METNHNSIIRYYESSMILNIHSDVSYLTEEKEWSRIGGQYSLGSISRKKYPININGTIHTLCIILQHAVVSASESGLGALFGFTIFSMFSECVVCRLAGFHRRWKSVQSLVWYIVRTS